MSLKLKQSVVGFLKANAEEMFTAREIAKWIFEKYPTECEQKKANSKSIVTNSDLLQQIVAEISSNRPRLQRENEELKTTDERPRQYYWTTKSDEAEIEEADDLSLMSRSISGGSVLNENELYIRLSEYLYYRHNVFSMRVDDRKSSNKRGKKGNKWRYPDLVGMEDLTKELDHEIKTVMKESGEKRRKLWSFEVKKLLNRSNVREAYFQAVSNSSWANYGYLAALRIDDSAMEELRVLCSLHGIGFVQLDFEDPTESRIQIPARENADVDWATCNRIAEENRDFIHFVKLVRQFHQTGDPRPQRMGLPRTL